jgi:hypothetical protein
MITVVQQCKKNGWNMDAGEGTGKDLQAGSE